MLSFVHGCVVVSDELSSFDSLCLAIPSFLRSQSQRLLEKLLLITLRNVHAKLSNLEGGGFKTGFSTTIRAAVFVATILTIV